jgi:hypothetical protein
VRHGEQRYGAAGRGSGFVEFRIGDHQHELGTIDRRFAPVNSPGGPGGIGCARMGSRIRPIKSILETLVRGSGLSALDDGGELDDGCMWTL